MRKKANTLTQTGITNPCPCSKLGISYLCHFYLSAATLAPFLSKVIRIDPLPRVSIHDRKSKCHITANIKLITGLAPWCTSNNLLYFQFEPETLCMCVCSSGKYLGQCNCAVTKSPGLVFFSCHFLNKRFNE